MPTRPKLHLVLPPQSIKPLDEQLQKAQGAQGTYVGMTASPHASPGVPEIPSHGTNTDTVDRVDKTTWMPAKIPY